MKFTKMHGIGNDYIYVNGFEEKIDNPNKVARFVSDRHFGIGSDGLILILPSQNADFKMRMFNADGTEAEMCGNATRCIGKYVFDNSLTDKTTVTLETLAGIKVLELNIKDGLCESVRVDMGEPILKPELIPVDSSGESFINVPVEVDRKIYKITAVSMGNPHAVVYVNNVDDIDIEKVGPKFENHFIFPRKTNTEFIQIIDRSTLKMRVWERGTGETLACGTGACGALVASVLNDLSDRKATLKLLGGDLFIEWNEQDNHVYMTGSATKVFDGEISL